MSRAFVLLGPTASGNSEWSKEVRFRVAKGAIVATGEPPSLTVNRPTVYGSVVNISGKASAGATVLVNGETMGGSELIVAALQDNMRATIVGQRTFGKASVQTMLALPLPNSGFKLTSGSFVRPSGKALHRFPDAARGYHGLGEEIVRDADGRVDAYVESVGTAHSILGVSTALRRQCPTVHVVAVEPAESPILSQGLAGAHRIEGIGIGFVPPAWDANSVNAIDAVFTDDAYAMARRLAAEEGIFAGGSTGANVVAALRVAERLGEGHTVATLAVDSGMKYLSTEVFRR